MERRALGRTGVEVSALCLGTMTWGSQNGYADVEAQMARALEAGVNFVDTAEMYPTTPRTHASFGDTERLLGRWIRESGRRDEIVLATKVTGAGGAVPGGRDALTGRILTEALDASLARLHTDRVELYQLHWPDRATYHFRQHWDYDPSSAPTGVMDDRVADVLRAADDAIRAGKIAAIGLSNDTAWGTMKFLEVAAREGLPRVASVQNEYGLLCRLYDTDMAEVSHREGVGLLAFSPLAAGMLSGKYANGAVPDGSRRTINDALGGRWNPRSAAAADAYAALAREHGMEPATLALAFCLTRPFMASVIIGATTAEQLETNLAAADVALPDEVLAGIDRIRREHPLPM